MVGMPRPGRGPGASVTTGQNQSSPGRVLLTREGRPLRVKNSQRGFNGEVTRDFRVWLWAGAGDQWGERLEGGSRGPGEARWWSGPGSR